MIKKINKVLHDIRVRFFLIGICITLLLYSAFFFGATYSCAKGDGLLFGFPLPECKNMKIIKACHDDKGDVYDYEEGYTDPYNISWGRL